MGNETDVPTGKVPSSSHRLPTVSASDALRQLRDAGARTIPTGLPILDRILVGQALSTFGHGGLVRGQLTEVFGPPGSGKTAFCLQAVASALKNENHVVWIDSAFPVPSSRLQALMQNAQKGFITRFHHYQAPGLPQMLALIHRAKAGFPPADTSLMIVDDISSIFPLAQSRPSGTTPSKFTRASGSIFRSTLLASLLRIASTQNIAIVLISDVTTRFRPESKAMLVGSLGGKEWEEPLSSRIALFREFPLDLTRDLTVEQYDDTVFDRLRYAGVLKANGVSQVENDAFKDVIPFSISDIGSIVPIMFPSPSSAPVIIKSPAPVRKRRIGEVPDSEEDWDAEVESLDGHEFDEAEDDVQIMSVQPVDETDLESRSKKAKLTNDDD